MDTPRKHTNVVITVVKSQRLQEAHKSCVPMSQNTKLHPDSPNVDVITNCADHAVFV